MKPTKLFKRFLQRTKSESTESTHVDGGLLNESHFLKQLLVAKHINRGLC